MIWVQKYGGTSVATPDRIVAVAKRIIRAVESGHQVVVVVSAMAGQTDHLLGLASTITHQHVPRELDMLLATGEQITMALLATALINLGCPARSLTATQAGILTDNVHNKARISDINASGLRTMLNQGQVPVLPGFQGVDASGAITTLGRGGSDTTAVAVAAALSADECQIYTDVEGVCTADPRVEPSAKLLSHVTFEEMMELASLGTKVLQLRAVEFAGKYKVPLRVLSSFSEHPGTLITTDGLDMERPVISGIAFSRDEAKLTVFGLPDKPCVAAQVFEPLSAEHIDIDVILQNTSADGGVDISFTVPRLEYARARAISQDVSRRLHAQGVVGDDKIAKISVVGVGMLSHTGIASRMFAALGKEGITIQLITTSEIKISVVVDEKYLELGVRVLHSAFGLDQVS